MGININLLAPHGECLLLASTCAARMLVYRKLVEASEARDEPCEIRLCTNKEWVIGSEQFKAQIETVNDRRLSRSEWGGDRKSKDCRAIK